MYLLCSHKKNHHHHDLDHDHDHDQGRVRAWDRDPGALDHGHGHDDDDDDDGRGVGKRRMKGVWKTRMEKAYAKGDMEKAYEIKMVIHNIYIYI